MAKIIELIMAEERTGRGSSDNPVRLKIQLWTKEGDLVAEFDPCADSKIEESFFNPTNIE